MRVALRILVILIAAGIAVLGLLPPRSPRSENDSEVKTSAGTQQKESDSAAPSPPPVIRDLLGGAALDQYDKAVKQLEDLDRPSMDELGFD